MNAMEPPRPKPNKIRIWDGSTGGAGAVNTLGVSMQPALNPDAEICDYVFLSKWVVRNYTVERGDIVSLISPKDPEQKIIKRIVALQGDVVSPIGYKKPYVKIPDGFCWVEGIDRHESLTEAVPVDNVGGCCVNPIPLDVLGRELGLQISEMHRKSGLIYDECIDRDKTIEGLSKQVENLQEENRALRSTQLKMATDGILASLDGAVKTHEAVNKYCSECAPTIKNNLCNEGDDEIEDAGGNDGAGGDAGVDTGVGLAL